MKARPSLRRIGAFLVGLAIAVLALACEEATGKPAATAQPASPSSTEPLTPAQSKCVPNVAIHRTNTGGAVQGAIKDLVLYWGGTRSNVECLPEAQGSQRQFNRVGNTQGGTATYRVIRVQRPAGARYYMLKYLDGEPVCIIDVAGACDRMLSGLGDYDVETLPAEVPALDGSPTPPSAPAPAPAPPQSTVPPEVVTGGTAYVVGTQATLGAKAAWNTRRAIVATASGALTVAATKTDPNGHLGTITSEGGVLTITGAKSTWDAATSRHNPIRIDFTATNAGGSTVSSWIQVMVDGAPERAPVVLPTEFTKRAIGVSGVLIRDLASYYRDPEGESVSVVDVSLSPSTSGIASIDSEGHLVLTPNNPGAMTITYYVTSTSNPSGNAAQYARDTVTVTITP